jgi:hypothetical protein
MRNRYQGYRLVNIAALMPRLWMILLALAIPFIIICSNYFEVLERTGTTGAIIADSLLSITITGYIAFVFILKSLKI